MDLDAHCCTDFPILDTACPKDHIERLFSQAWTLLERAKHTRELNELSAHLHVLLDTLVLYNGGHSHGDVDVNLYLGRLCCTAAYVRDYRFGWGERRLSYMMVAVVHAYFPVVAERLFRSLVLDGYGGWRDVCGLCQYLYDRFHVQDHPLISFAIGLIHDQLSSDWNAFTSGKCTGKVNEVVSETTNDTPLKIYTGRLTKVSRATLLRSNWPLKGADPLTVAECPITNLHRCKGSTISYAAKWIPREKSKHAWLFKLMVEHWYYRYCHLGQRKDPFSRDTFVYGRACALYRRVFATLTVQALDPVECKMCLGQWSAIVPDRVSSGAKSLYLDALSRHDCSVRDGGPSLYLGDIVGRMIRQIVDDNDNDMDQVLSSTLDQDWAKHCSMYRSRVRNGRESYGTVVPVFCMNVGRVDHRLHLAIARACLLMECGLACKGLVLATVQPRWVNLSACLSLTDYVKTIMAAFCSTGTNLRAALDLLRFAKQSTGDADITNCLVFDDGTQDLAPFSSADMKILSWSDFELGSGPGSGPGSNGADPWTILAEHPRYNKLCA